MISPVGSPSPVLAPATKPDAAAQGFERILFEQLAGDMLEPLVDGPYASLVTPVITDAVLGK